MLKPHLLAHFESHVLGVLPVAVAQHKLLKQGRHRLEFAGSLARPQVERGGRFLFEHFWAAASWNELCFKELLATDGMRRVRCDQSQF